jgi:hypothetical protein
MHITYSNVLESMTDLLNDENFQTRHKQSKSAFTRNRKLNFSTIAGMILRMIKQSLQITCNWLGDLVGAEPASKQAFSKARQKISPECFCEMHSHCLDVHYTAAPKDGLWKEYRLIGCDGSTIRLPESEELAKKFGRGPSKAKSADAPPMARISEFTDMTMKLTLSGRIAPYQTSEEVLAQEQLEEVTTKMKSLGQNKLIFVYDRGYPSDSFINKHVALGVDFVFRLPKNFNRCIKEIHKEGAPENLLVSEGWPLLRVVQFELPSGEIEILLTSLTDEVCFSTEDLSDLYRGRWSSMEEGYKRQKITMQLENFSGKTALSIEQEFWATLTVGNIIELGCIGIEGPWIPGNLPEKQVNRSVVFGSMRDMTMQVILGMKTVAEVEDKMRKVAKRLMIKVRPDRKFSRANVGKPKRHHIYRRAC